MKVNNSDLTRILSIETKTEEFFLALSNSVTPNTLTFCDTEKYLPQIKSNSNITGLFLTEEMKQKIQRNDLTEFVVEDPRYSFYYLLNEVSKEKYNRWESEVDKSAQIHKTAYVSDHNVSIGSNTIISANVTILADVTIGNNCVIQPGTVIGSEGFEYKKTSKGILSVFHNGQVVIKNYVEIGSNTCVDKGFSFRDTIINDNVKIDNLVHIAHGVQIDENSFIIASAMLGGSVTIGKNVWVSPNTSIAPGLTIGDNAFISLGAIVTKNVDTGQQVTGNFAIPHDRFLKNFKKSLAD